MPATERFITRDHPRREIRPRGFRSRSDRPAAIEERRISDGGLELSAHPLLVQYALREGKGGGGEGRRTGGEGEREAERRGETVRGTQHTGKTKSREKIENQSYAVGSPDYPTVSGLNLSLFFSLPDQVLLVFSLPSSLPSSFSLALSHYALSLFLSLVLALLFSTSTEEIRDGTTTTTVGSGGERCRSRHHLLFLLLPLLCGPRGPRSSLIQSNESRSSIRHTRRQISFHFLCFPLSFSVALPSRGRSPPIFEKVTTGRSPPFRRFFEI